MTALQELYKQIGNIEKKSNTGLISLLDLKRMIGNYYLEKEKQQIIDAYKEGCFDSILDESTDLSRAKEYYDQTFKVK